MLVNSFRICGNVARRSLVLRISDTYCQATWEFRRASSRQVSYVGFQNKWGAFLCKEHTWNWFDYLARPQLPIIVSGQGFHKTMSDSKELAWPTNAFAANRALCLSWSFMQYHLTSNFAWHIFLGSNFKFFSVSSMTVEPLSQESMVETMLWEYLGSVIGCKCITKAHKTPRRSNG